LGFRKVQIALCFPGARGEDRDRAANLSAWLGYFDLLDQVDKFVVLDSVQFEKQSWQQRNRIKTPTGLQWLTVPVVFRGRLGQRIVDVEIREAEFGTTIARRRAELPPGPFFRQVLPSIA